MVQLVLPSWELLFLLLEVMGIHRVQFLGQDSGQWAFSWMRCTYAIQSGMQVDVLDSGWCCLEGLVQEVVPS